MAATQETKKRKIESDDDEDYVSYDDYEDNVNRLYFLRDSDCFDATLPATIEVVEAAMVMDRRGYATLEVSVTLHNGIWATTSLPSGAPPGIYNYVQYASVYRNYVNRDVDYINNVISPALIGKDPTKQTEIDKLMIDIQEHDGTAKDRNMRRQKLGINAIMAVSVAVCKAGAYVKNVPLVKHVADLAGTSKLVVPIPSVKLINGGSVSDNNLPFQEISITPFGVDSFHNACMINTFAYASTEKAIIERDGLGSFVVDEHGNVMWSYDGFTMNVQDVKECLDFLKDTAHSDPYVSGKVTFGMGFSVSEFYNSTSMMYDLNIKYLKNAGSGKISGAALKDYYTTLMNEHDSMISSISSPFHQDDWDNYSKLTAEIGTKAHVVMEDNHLLDDGSDFERLKKAIKEKTCNALLLKVNHRASLTECIEIVKLCKEAGWAIVMASQQCSGAPTDAFIADLSVGLAVDEIKIGSPLDFKDQFMEICAEFYDEAEFAMAPECGEEMNN